MQTAYRAHERLSAYGAYAHLCKGRDGHFVIENFSSITSDDRLYSPPFTAAGREWIIWVDPRGWGAGKGTHLAVVLKVVGGGEIDATYELVCQHSSVDVAAETQGTMGV